MGLALDIGLGGLALRVERVEVLLEPVIGRHPRVDGAAQRLWAGLGHPASFLSRRPKKRGPFQRVPVIARATWDRLLYVVPFQAKPSASTITRWDLSVPLADQHRAGPEPDPVGDRDHPRARPPL